LGNIAALERFMVQEVQNGAEESRSIEAGILAEERKRAVRSHPIEE